MKPKYTHQYKIKIGTDERDVASTLLSYEKRRAGVVGNIAETNQDQAVVEACRGLANLLDSREMEIKIRLIPKK